MLVIGRKLGEKVFIAPDICITVVKIDRGKVRLAFEAPRQVEIWRTELLAKVNAQKPPGPAAVPS